MFYLTGSHLSHEMRIPGLSDPRIIISHENRAVSPRDEWHGKQDEWLLTLYQAGNVPILTRKSMG